MRGFLLFSKYGLPPLSTCLKTHIQSFYRMCQSTYRDKVYTTFGIVTQRIESDTTRRLGFITTAHHIHSLLCHFRCEVIKHDTVYATKIKHLLQLIEVTYFNLYLEVFTFFLAIFFSTIDSLIDASGKSHDCLSAKSCRTVRYDDLHHRQSLQPSSQGYAYRE